MSWLAEEFCRDDAKVLLHSFVPIYLIIQRWKPIFTLAGITNNHFNQVIISVKLFFVHFFIRPSCYYYYLRLVRKK